MNLGSCASRTDAASRAARIRAAAARRLLADELRARAVVLVAFVVDVELTVLRVVLRTAELASSGSPTEKTTAKAQTK